MRHPTGRPEPGEFADYAADDIAFVRGDDAIDVLRQQGQRVTSMLDAWSDAAVAGVHYAAGKWTVKEVVGHLIDDERIFAYRALCVARGDRTPLPGFDEKLYVEHAGFEARPLASLREEYAIVRGASLALFGTMTDDQWLRRGIVNGYEASARGLAFHIAGHELHHLRIIDAKYWPLIR
jgi:hypothetical protein